MKILEIVKVFNSVKESTAKNNFMNRRPENLSKPLLPS